MKKILGIAVIGCFLSSCAPSEKSIHDARMKYMYQMPYELCMNYLSLPDWNQWQQYRAEAISKRKIDCSPWQEEAYALKQKKVMNSGIQQEKYLMQLSMMPTMFLQSQKMEKKWFAQRNKLEQAVWQKQLVEKNNIKLRTESE